MTEMSLAPLLYAVVAALAMLLSVGAAMVLMAALAPEFRRGIEGYMGQEGGVSLLAGLAVMAHVGLLVLVLLPRGPLGLAASGVLLSGMVGLQVLGLSAVALRLGRRILLLREASSLPSELACLLVGTPILLLTTFVPLFGWLVMSYAVILGLGATVRGLVDAALKGRRSHPVGISG